MSDLNCPACGAGPVRVLFRLGPVPVLVNRLCATEAEALSTPTADIALAYCQECGFVWNSCFDVQKVHYDLSYDNSQDAGQGYQRHAERMLALIMAHVDLKGKKVLEVGCGKGRFLKALAGETGCRAWGADPSYPGETETPDGRCVFLREPYDGGLAERLGYGQFDLVLLRHVFDQMPDPMGTMLLLTQSLKPGGCLCIEGPDLQHLLGEGALFDLSYERYAYFTPQTLAGLMGRAQLGGALWQTGFQDQYAAVLAWKGREGTSPGGGEAAPDRIETGIRELERCKNAAIPRLRERLSQLGRDGRIALWGAANRGVMFCNLADGTRELIDCVIDILPSKQGCFIPGSGHEILPPEALKSRGIRSVVIANPNYQAEIEQQILDMGLKLNTYGLDALAGGAE